MNFRILLLAMALTTFARAQNLTQSLTACYPMNGTGFEPVNMLTGTLSAITPTVDRFNNSGSALAFSGSTLSYVQLPNSPLIKPTASLSLSFWMRPTGVGIRHVIYAGNGCGSYFEAYCVALANSGGSTKASIVKAAGTCGNQTILYGTTTIAANNWYHIGAYFGNDSLKLYVNGVLEGTAAITAAFAYSSQGVVVGGTNINFWNFPFMGTMDNLRFYNRKLSGQEFAQLYLQDPSCNEPMVPTTAAFTAPDTVCTGYPFNVQNMSTGTVTSHYWSVCNNTTAPTVTTKTVASSVGTGPVFTTTHKDNSNYYTFITNHLGGTLTRLSFGNSLSNTPTVTSLGSFSGGMSLAGGIDIMQDGSNWYGAIVGGGSSAYLAKLSFGASLANTPTLTNVGNIGSLSYPHNIHLFKSGSTYHGLVINQTSNSITRLSFGSSLANTPTGTNLTGLSLSAPSQMEIVTHAGNWHVFVCNDSPTSTLTRLDFGNTLLNTPTVTALGNPGGMLNGPRGISLFPSCSGFKGYIANRITNQIVSVNIAGGATGLVSLSASGISAGLNFPHDMERVRVGDTSLIFVVNTSSNNMIRLKFPDCSSAPSSTLQNPGPFTLGTAGTYTMTLATNENQPEQGYACKQIVAISNFTIGATANPSLACANVQRTLTANGAASFTWMPGNLTGASIVVTPASNMVYTVTGTKGNCTASQTVAVQLLPGTTVSAFASPTAVCQGNSSTLTAIGAVSYSWQPGNLSGSTQVVSPFASTIYTVSGTNAVGCVSSATVQLVVNPYPVVSASPAASTVCPGSFVTMQASGALSYTWLPGNSNASSINVSPASSTTFTLMGMSNGCRDSTTAQVTVAGPVNGFVASSSTLCSGETATLSLTGAIAGGSTFTLFPGNTSTAPFTVSPVSSVVYTMSGFNGCAFNKTLALTVYAPPVLTASSSPTVICRGNTASLSVSGASSYTWQPGNLTGASQTVSPFSTTIYSVSGTATTGCISTRTVQLNVNPNPTLTINPASATICAGSSTLLAGGGAGTYTWFPGGAVTQAINVSPASSSIYTLNGTLNNCPGSQTVLVTVNSNPTVTATASSPSVCSGSGTGLSASGAVSYTWLPGNLTGASISVTPAVSGAYTVVGANAAGCRSATQVAVTVVVPPVVTTAVSPSSTLCTGNNFTISGSGASSYTWQPGSFMSSSVAASALIPGTFVFTVTGSAAGCTASATQTVYVNPTPTVSAMASPSVICAGETLTLTASGAGSYSWLTPSLIFGNNFTVSPASSMVYTVTGTSSNCSDTRTVPVLVQAVPSLTVTSNANPACSGSTVTLTGSGAATYTWQPGSINTGAHSFTAQNNISYTLAATGANGCTATAQYLQNVNPTPTISAVSSASAVCSGFSAIISASGASGSYTFNPGNLVGNNVTVTPTSATVYTVTGASLGCSGTTTLAIGVNPVPAVSISLPPNICSGQSATMTASGASTYTWYPGAVSGPSIAVMPAATTAYTVNGSNSAGCVSSATAVLNVTPSPTLNVSASAGTICTGTNATITASGAASYTWSAGSATGAVNIVSPLATTVYTVIGVNGSCADSRTIEITVVPQPTVSIQSSVSSICEGEPSVLTASGAGSYLWQPGNLTGASVTVSPLVSTQYSVQGNSGGCFASAMVSLSVNSRPTVLISPSSLTLCIGDAAVLTASGAVSYSWAPMSQTGSSVSISPTATTVYTVTALGANGCTATAARTVEVMSAPMLSLTLSAYTICAGNSFTASAAGGISYQWLPGAQTGTTAIFTPAASGTYSLVSTIGACTVSSVFAVEVIPCAKPVFGLTQAASVPRLYNGNYYLSTFTVVAVNGSSVTLTDVDLQNDLASSFPYPCTYTVVSAPVIRSVNSGLRADAQFDGGLRKSLTVASQSTLFPNRRDTLLLTLLIDPQGYSGPVRNVVVGYARTPSGAVVADSSNNGFSWDPDKDGDPTNNNEFTTLDLKAIDLFVPEAFSPDGDGKYDEFLVKGLQGRRARLTIFNRWGDRLFETEGSDLRWDGLAHNGVIIGKSKVPPATYYYVLQFLDAGKESKHGFVEVRY